MMEEDPDEQLTGKSELVNGIEINHHDLMSPTGLAGSSKKQRTAKPMMMEETKVNFYDPQGDHLVEAATGLYDTAEN